MIYIYDIHIWIIKYDEIYLMYQNMFWLRFKHFVGIGGEKHIVKTLGWKYEEEKKMLYNIVLQNICQDIFQCIP